MKFMKLGSKPDDFQTDGSDVRFVASELATDIIVTVGRIKFYLHKFPLLSKSAYLQRLVGTSSSESSDDICIPDIPGGPNAFELCAKFCYGMTVTLNAYNVVAVRCASEFLEMHETLEKGNLIYKIDVFLNSSIFRSWKDSIIALQTTKSLLPWSENLKVTGRCIDSVANRASIDTSKVEWSYTYNRKNLPSEGGLDPNWNGVKKQQMVPKDWWVQDLCDLDMDFYKRVIMAIKDKGRISNKVIGEALKAYAYRRLSGFGNDMMGNGGDSIKHRTLVETIVWLLPAEVGSAKCGFLLKLLRAASALDCSEICRKELVNRIGYQLEEASVSDLLIPSTGETTVYDVDMVFSMVEKFVMRENGSSGTSPPVTDEAHEIKSLSFVSDASKLAVARLIDGYLAEIARDPNLPLIKFINLAGMISDVSRPVHDALYRAIDMYLKEHPSLGKTEKRRICHLLDCRKLSMDACMHAVQNERLPLRVAVQVLFIQQMRAAAATGGMMPDHPMTNRSLPKGNGGSNVSLRSAATTKTEDEWDAAATVDDDIKSMPPPHGNERNGDDDGYNKNAANDKGNNKVKGMLTLTPKKMLNKIWSNSSSDTSESPGSTNLEESKSTLSRNTRNSVS